MSHLPPVLRVARSSPTGWQAPKVFLLTWRSRPWWTPISTASCLSPDAWPGKHLQEEAGQLSQPQAMQCHEEPSRPVLPALPWLTCLGGRGRARSHLSPSSCLQGESGFCSYSSATPCIQAGCSQWAPLSPELGTEKRPYREIHTASGHWPQHLFSSSSLGQVVASRDISVLALSHLLPKCSPFSWTGEKCGHTGCSIAELIT